jgi:putative ABC transport system permease protein
MLVAILPSLAATRGDLTGAMKEGARSAGPGIGSIRRPSAQQALVVAEIALAMTMLTAAGLTVRSLERLMNVRLGFDPEGITVARLTLPAARYRVAAERTAFVERLTEHLRAIPGVRHAAVATSLPFTGNSSAAIMIPEGTDAPDPAQRYYRNSVTPDFFSALGIAIIRGRTFTDFDGADAPLVAVINESAARRIWGTDDAVGRRFRLGTAEGPAVEVIGIAEDARFRNLTTDLSGARVEPDVYFPFAQRSDRDIEIAVSTQAAGVVIEDLQRATAAVNASLPLYRVQRLADALRQQTSTARFGSTLLTAFSGGALLLAAIGLYGLISYIVSLNRREIGIRLALGADTRRVITLILGNGMALVVTGLVLGALGAAAAGRALEAQLYQTPAIEPITYATVALVLVVVTAIACVIPTRRAVRVDPQSALRAE